MFGVAIAAVVLVACSSAIGQGLCALSGRRAWAWWAPGAGFAAMLVIAGVLIRVPGHSKSAALGIALATIASLLAPSVRRALRSALPEGLPVVVLALLFSVIPFLVWGRTGILGEGMNNDSGAHLGTAWWLQYHRGPAPVGALGGALALVGYPDGPHGIIAALSLSVGGISLEHAFDGLLIAIAPLTALAALGLLPAGRRTWRLVAALLAGMSYLALSFQVQASFKETMEGLLVVAVVGATRDLLQDFERPLRWRAAIPLGVLVFGSVYIYSYGGVVWTVAAMGAVVVFSGRLRTAVAALPGFLLTAAVVLLPAAPQVARFLKSPFHAENGDGNLLHHISAFEVLGVWFNYDFRWTPNPLWPTVIGIAIVCLATAIAVTRLVRRGQLVVLGASLPILAIFAYSAAAKSIYLAAKAGAIAAPLVVVVVASGLLLTDDRRPARGLRIGLGAVAVLAAACAAWSSFLVLRDARVGPTAHSSELAQLRHHIHGGRTLFLPKNDLIQWELIGVPVGQVRNFYAPIVVPRSITKPGATAGFTDFDSVDARVLNKFDYAITTNTPYQSSAPPAWHRLATTRSYVLWARHHRRTHTRYSTDFADSPGRILHCNTPYGRLREGGARDGYAVVMPRPITARAEAWSSQPRFAGQTATLSLRVPRGTWDLSLTYSSNPGLVVTAGSLRRQMPATIDRNGPYYVVGTIHQAHTGMLTIRATQRKINWFGRLIGSEGRTRALDAPSNWPLGGVALTRHPLKPRKVAPLAACGRYVDNVVPGNKP